MFGNLPKPTKNSASNIIDEAKKFSERSLGGFKDFSTRIPKELKDYSSGLIDVLKDVQNTRLIYDGCNAGIRVGSGGLVKFYRNKYCDIPSTPPVYTPPPNQEPIGNFFCNSGVMLVYLKNSVRPISYFVNSDDGFEVIWQHYNSSTQQIYGTVTLIFSRTSRDRTFKQGSGTGDYQGATSTSQFTTLYNSIGVNVFATQERAIEIYNVGASTGFYGYLATCTPPPKIEPPPPPPKKECCMSNCCPDNSNIEALLKLILKRIGEPKTVTIFDEDLNRQGSQKANKTPDNLNEYLKLAVERIEIANRIMGIENFPVTVPDTMIEPFKEGVFAKAFKFIDGNKKRKLNTITEFIAWLSEQDSAVLGQFHQVIEFQNEDKKTSHIVLPNVAESLKEILLLVAQMAKQNNVQTELLFKLSGELLATRAAATKASKISEDIQDYLDYPTQTKSAKIPTNISLPKITTDKSGKPIANKQSESHKNYLQPGEIKYTYDDWTGENSLHDQLLDLLQLSAMLRAIYFQRTDNG